MCHHLDFHRLDLGVEGSDYRGQRPHDRGVCTGHHGWLAELLSTQRGLDLHRPLGRVTPPGAVKRATDARVGQAGRGHGVGSGAQELQSVGGGQVVEGVQRSREELPQRAPQSQQVAVAVPDQGLVGAGDQLDGLGQVAVPGDRAVRGPVQADQLGQGVRVAGVALGTRCGVLFPIAGGLHRVDRIHLVPGCEQRLDPRAPVGLDPDHDLPRFGILRHVGRDQLVQPGDPLDPLTQPRLGQPTPSFVDELDVVMVLGPIVPDESNPHPPCQHRHPPGSARENHQRTNGQVLTQGGTSSHQRSTLPDTGKGTV